MEVYDRAVRTLPEPERLAVYELYLGKASDFFGVGKARHSGRLLLLSLLERDSCVKCFFLQRTLVPAT